jgi:hypothetical protein
MCANIRYNLRLKKHFLCCDEESLGLRQVINKMPADFSGHFAFELCAALYLQTSCVGFEGLALQAKLRPAVGRRIPRYAGISSTLSELKNIF